MTKRPVTNLPASIRDRLLTLAHAGGLNFQPGLVRYYQERLLDKSFVHGAAGRRWPTLSGEENAAAR